MANSAQFIFSQLLTDFGSQLGVGEFGASQRVAPLFRTPQIKGVHEKRDRAKIGAVDMKRGLGEEYKRKQSAKGEMVPFFNEDHGIIMPVPMEIVDGYSPADLFSEKANASAEALIEVNKAHADAVRATTWSDSQAGFETLYGASNVVVPSTKWDASGSTIEDDIKKAKNRVRLNSGVAPNVIAFNQEVFDAITSNANSSIYDKLKYTSGQSITREQLAGLFGVEEIIVFGELNNTANAGQAVNYTDLYPEDAVLIFHRNNLPIKRKVTLATTFYWDNARAPFMGVQERFNEDTLSYEFKAGAYFDVKMINAEAGNVLWDVLT